MPADAAPRRSIALATIALATIALATIVLATFALPSPALAQQVLVRDLPAPTREFEDPFSKIGGGLELHPGQVVVMDAKEMQITLVDFVKGTRTAVGRRGAGPGEYGALWTSAFTAKGDTIWVYDLEQRRLVSFGPDLTAGPVIPFPISDLQTGMRIWPPFFGDRSNRFFAGGFHQPPTTQAGAGLQTVIPDSLAILRTDLHNPTIRSEVARVRFNLGTRNESKRAGDVTRTSMIHPGLVASDPWTVFADGRIAIVRGGSYSVEFIKPDGTHAALVRVPYDQIKVTDADRKAEMAKAESTMREMEKGFQKAGRQIEFELLPPVEWPATYPAVAENGALAGPDGRLWVKRMMPVRVGREQWDVLDTAGKLVARWRLPTRTSIFAIGLGVVYTVRTDDDDLMYVQRVELPR
jgi:hypothetical protein